MTDDEPDKLVLDEDENTAKNQLFISLFTSIPFQQIGRYNNRN